ncbi:MAG: hypothetical protein ACFFGZ_12615 [Candidatus Thorarchaeota archaeon]
MTNIRNKKVSSRLKRLGPERKILKVTVFAPIAKPLNGSLPRSNTSFLLKLYELPYVYGRGPTKSNNKAKLYFLKGMRGAIRHAAMQVAHELGVEVCHTSDKETDKEKNPLIPDGFHPLGFCATNGGSCLIHQIFGSRGHEGLISVFAYPITNLKHNTAQLPIPVQNVHMAIENRICKTFDGKSIQDFGEQYFSGEIIFEIDVSLCSPLQLGFLMQAVMGLERLGRGYNTGYGHIEVLEFQLLQRMVKKIPTWNGNTFQVTKEIQEESLKKEAEDALQEWDNYASRS